MGTLKQRENYTCSGSNRKFDKVQNFVHVYCVVDKNVWTFQVRLHQMSCDTIHEIQRRKDKLGNGCQVTGLSNRW